ncbi:Uncharacterised protein [uncultured Blautia sp.]|nr:Uncharacterised protein [uncultured Blautia sp.]
MRKIKETVLVKMKKKKCQITQKEKEKIYAGSKLG